jgi:hypothetical protein
MFTETGKSLLKPEKEIRVTIFVKSFFSSFFVSEVRSFPPKDTTRLRSNPPTESDQVRILSSLSKCFFQKKLAMATSEEWQKKGQQNCTHF